ncbi:hypothetical protein OLMES_1171 [Oleiphilus messinensis]|uniref:Uncharacterized protein n=1 Tax=Oleiphilus messinensis TaxID=141451 RepID=A0A1Y0I6V5_9GAMM|nr:hypothetical protein OLMES_1171 [Oleiphilus messinensis]
MQETETKADQRSKECWTTPKLVSLDDLETKGGVGIPNDGLSSTPS